MSILFFCLTFCFCFASYTSGIQNNDSPCTYGFRFMALTDDINIVKCYNFDESDTLVEGFVLDLDVYVPYDFIQTTQFSRCGECMQLTSLSGEVFRVMIGGYHTNDDNLIYGSQTIFDDLSPFTDGLDLLPVSIQMSSCSFYGDPSMIVLNSNETGIELQPFNTKIAHYVLIADDIEYPINIQTASYLIPTFTITTLKLVSLHRVAISFSNVTSNIGDITYANTQFPTVTPSNTCSFVPESVLYESGTTLEHIDEYFQWQLYRVTPSTRLKQIEVVDDVFSFSFSTEEIELVMGYPVYLQFTRYFDVLEFHFTSDCSVDFVSADMFTLSDTTKYESGKTVKCSNVESSFTTKEYRNDLGNVVLYGNLLKLNIDLSCSAYVNYVSFSLQGIIGATITVDKLFFNTVDTYSNITKCYPESVYCNSYCTPNTNESCTAFCGKCGVGMECIDGNCQYITTNTRSSAYGIMIGLIFMLTLLL